jgi:hypothetical protein
VIFRREVRSTGTADACRKAVHAISEGLFEYGEGKVAATLQRHMNDIYAELVDETGRRFVLTIRLDEVPR